MPTDTYVCDRFIRMAKLTLSVDERVIQRAKQYAQARGTSVSGLVEQLLDLATSGAAARAVTPPILARLRGSLKSVDIADYRRYLERKYR
jgi:Family of unknown function (DUF6364)